MRMQTPWPPLGHIWDVMLVWMKENINKTSLCYSIVYYCTGAQRYMQYCAGRSTISGFHLAWFSCLSSEHLCVFDHNFFLLPLHLYLWVSWAWWDWPLTWLTNHCPSVLWHCWLGHTTHKNVSEMTCNVSSGMLNPTVPYSISTAWTMLWQDVCHTPVFCRNGYTLCPPKNDTHLILNILYSCKSVAVKFNTWYPDGLSY